MFSRLFLALALLAGGTGLSHAVHVVMCGGPALRQWEGLRIQPDRHDNWWANFVRASTIRIAQIQQKDPSARITWIVYRPGYATRGREDGKPYTRWIADLASKYKIKLVWVDSADQAIRALNSSPRFRGDFVESFYYFGHSNCFAWMLDYGNNIMAVSTEWIHETDLNRIRRDIFTPRSDCWSFGCYTGPACPAGGSASWAFPSGATRNPPATALSPTAGCRKAWANGLNRHVIVNSE